MVSYKDAGKMLDKLMEALPEGIFDGLNGGVNLIEKAESDGRGGYILGLYHNNMMGRYIELFYGSFRELYGDIPHEQFELRLRSTLHHELTHHIEGLAGDRSLEHWDEEQEYIWDELEQREGMEIASILFVDDDDTALAPAAKALFDMYAAERCPDIPSESAGLFAAGEAPQPDCVKAAEALGADMAAGKPKLLTPELFASFDAVMCMTLAQMDELLDRFPGSEARVVCADDTDILRPRLRINWKKAVERLASLMDAETEQLRMDAEEICYERLGPDCPAEYIEAIARLEEENFSTPWTADMLERAMGDGSKHFYGALCGGELLGYIGAQLIVDELEIFNVAVDSACRGRHIGDGLVEELCAFAEAVGVVRISLEVRESNTPAIGLYLKHGFTEVARRKNYYEKPREDAILMDKTF